MILDERGAPLGSVTLPGPALQVHEVNRTTVRVTERYEDGFLSVIRYRIER